MTDDIDDFLSLGPDETADAVPAPAPRKDIVIEVDHAKAVKIIKELEKSGAHSAVHGGDIDGTYKEGKFDLSGMIWDAINGADDDRLRRNAIDGLFPAEDVLDPELEAEYRANNNGELPPGYKYWVSTHARRDYPSHMAHFAAGLVYPERLFAAGNRTGKTVCGAYETALHLSGEYPAWWEGRRIQNRKGRQNKIEPISGLAVGVSTYLLREVLQRELLGPPTEPSRWGTGAIRGALIRGTSRMPNVAFGVEKILVEHVSGTISELIMRPSDAGADRFAGTNHDFAWLDEKMDPKVYYEVMARVGATRGITYMTYTPVDGVNEIINRFMPEQFVTSDDKQKFDL